MAIFFTITLLLSIVGMAGLLLLKRYELTTGNILWASVRPATGRFFHRGLTWFEYVLPGLLRVGARRFYLTVRHLLRAALAWSIVIIERGLEGALHTLRHKTTLTPKEGGEASAFLREVAEHKKELLKNSPNQAIFEE